MLSSPSSSALLSHSTRTHLSFEPIEGASAAAARCLASTKDVCSISAGTVLFTGTVGKGLFRYPSFGEEVAAVADRGVDGTGNGSVLIKLRRITESKLLGGGTGCGK